MENFIYKLLRKELSNKYTKVFLCVGTNKCIGDSLGPCVGEILSNKIKSNDIRIIGTLNNNINSCNINRVINHVNNSINNPYFIIIDSALSKEEFIGEIIIERKSMKVGEALNKKHKLIGNISIKGIVGKNDESNIRNFINLNNVSKEMINDLSYKIANPILKALEV